MSDKTKSSDLAPERHLEKIVAAADPDLLYHDVSTQGRLMLENKGIEVFLVEGAHLSELALTELGRAREEVFRSVGEGSGKASDTDKYDLYYNHMIAIDSETHKILGAYRLGRIDQVINAKGIEGVYSYQFFDHRAVVLTRQAQTLELGRSFADPTAGTKALRALDSIWKGISVFVAENPQYRYMMGPVSISNAYSPISQLIMLKYLERHTDKTIAAKVFPRHPIKVSSQFQAEIDFVVSELKDIKELNKLIQSIDGIGIPSLLMSYGKMDANYMGFDLDVNFGTTDGLIMVDFLNPKADAELSKHFGTKWEQYKVNAQQLSPAL